MFLLNRIMDMKCRGRRRSKIQNQYSCLGIIWVNWNGSIQFWSRIIYILHIESSNANLRSNLICEIVVADTNFCSAVLFNIKILCSELDQNLPVYYVLLTLDYLRYWQRCQETNMEGFPLEILCHLRDLKNNNKLRKLTKNIC